MNARLTRQYNTSGGPAVRVGLNDLLSSHVGLERKRPAQLIRQNALRAVNSRVAQRATGDPRFLTFFLRLRGSFRFHFHSCICPCCISFVPATRWESHRAVGCLKQQLGRQIETSWPRVRWCLASLTLA